VGLAGVLVTGALSPVVGLALVVVGGAELQAASMAVEAATMRNLWSCF
jgi:hypothetical protein